MANPIAVIETNMGTIKAELFSDKVPGTVGNFIKLAEKQFYDGVLFHRVIDGFMIQGGCPEGTGFGGPGYTIKDEFHASLRHKGEGLLSMANTGQPNTGGCQFFITLAPTPNLDKGHRQGPHRLQRPAHKGSPDEQGEDNKVRSPTGHP
jgi:cyclophilin family peptidyl-prolyl cis-trans isomerase